MSGTEYGAAFRAAEGATQAAADVLVLQGWSESDWKTLFACTRSQEVRPSEVVIQREAKDRALAFVDSGLFEVGITQVDGVSIAPLARIGPGSVIGEQSFFDGHPRSANVWAITEGRLLMLTYEAFERFSREEPALARDLVFGLARVLSMRLRNTTFRVRR